MFIKFRVIDSISLKPIRGCKLQVACDKFSSWHIGDGNWLVGLPKDCKNISLKIHAPLYKTINYNILASEVSDQLIVGLDFMDIFEEDVVTA